MKLLTLSCCIDSIENLMGAGKGEHCPYVCALINKVFSFALGIKVHITSLVELMSKMSAFDNTGEVTAIELQGSWVLHISCLTTHEQALGLRLFWIDIIREQEIVLSCILVTYTMPILEGEMRMMSSVNPAAP